MLPELGRIGPLILRSYSVTLSLALLAGLGSLAWHGWRIEDRHTKWLDAGLAAVVAGLAGGRLEHVAIHFAYFAERPAEVPQVWLGGLEWHLAVGSGLLALWLAGRHWKIKFGLMLDALAVFAPIGAALAFGGCWLAGCGYGREVASLADYVPGMASELPDGYGIVAPRLNTQAMGLIASLVIAGVVWLLASRVARHGAAFWVGLALLAATAFALGTTRGDPQPMLGPLRLDQALDLVVAVAALIGLYLSLNIPKAARPTSAKT